MNLACYFPGFKMFSYRRAENLGLEGVKLILSRGISQSKHFTDLESNVGARYYKLSFSYMLMSNEKLAMAESLFPGEDFKIRASNGQFEPLSSTSNAGWKGD
ncbi:hypothetical protein KIL84_013653 [Mauremys mutica]|uniref:Uncharacterized protein n=1 Tax=Mauremys mutica TaxID=74926 RepID=A0A9D4ASB2_9SAUR|nr:hypothetical protein KIL84_013653 [Mauremys mutica]